jgi:hypothetical protein
MSFRRMLVIVVLGTAFFYIMDRTGVYDTLTRAIGG